MPTASKTEKAYGDGGFFGLTLGLILGPVVALVNQAAIYIVNMRACGRDLHQWMHVIPVACLVLVGIAALVAESNRRGASRDGESNDVVVSRTYFLAVLGLGISLISAIVIIAQWVSVISFDPCMR
jgi:hypothetical protein